MIEANPMLTFLASAERERRRREQQAATQPPPEMPEWASKLDPNDFKGATKTLLLKAQQGGAGDNQRSSDQLSSEQLAAMVPFDTRPRQSPVAPDTRQRLSPVASDTRERIIGQEAATGAPGGFSGGYGAANPELGIGTGGPMPTGAPRQQKPAPAPSQAAQDINLRKELGAHVGGAGGSYIDMMRQHRRTGALPGVNGMASGRGQAQPQGTSAFRGATLPGQLPGGAGGNRPPAQTATASPAGGAGQATARGSAGSDNLAGGAAPRTGGGLFGGSGPGLGYVLGGIGALMQEAGGQEGAVGNFVERYQKYVTTNKTAKHAKDIGVPDEDIALFMVNRDGPGLMKYTLEWKKAQRESQQPDYDFMNVDGTVVRTDKRGGTVSPVYEGAGGQTIPGTKIGFDTDIGRKYSAYTNQGFSHEQALAVASGRFDLKVTDTGIPVMVDTLSNREVPIQRLGPSEIEQRQQLGPTPGRQAQQGQPQQAGQTDALGLDPQRDKTLYQMADSGTGLWNIMGDFAGRVGPQFVPGDKPFFPDQREAVTTIRTANRGLIRALQQSPRYAEGERKSIEQEIALNPSIGMSPEAWRQSAVAVDRLLRTWWNEDMQDAQSSTLAAEDRQRALGSARAIERYLQILGVPQGGGQGTGQIQPQGRAGGQGSGSPVSVASPAEAQALPPDTLYRTPDGRTFRTPAGSMSNQPQAGGQRPPFDAQGNPVIAETGESFPPDVILQQAREEIANGRSRAAVIKRLRDMGISPVGL